MRGKGALALAAALASLAALVLILRLARPHAQEITGPAAAPDSPALAAVPPPDEPPAEPDPSAAPAPRPQPPSPPAAQETPKDAAHVVEGTVIDRETGEPVEGAEIAFGSEMHDTRPAFACRTDHRGRFRFTAPGPPARRIVVYAFHPGYDAWNNAANAPLTPPITTVRLPLAPGGRILGKVLEQGSERPLAGVEVRLALGGSFEGASSVTVDRRCRTASTDAQGSFAFSCAPLEDIVTLSASARGYAPQVRGLRLVRGAPAEEVTLRLSPAVTLRGRVADLHGRGLPEVPVYCFPQAWRILLGNPEMTWTSSSSSEPMRAQKTLTGADGSFAFPGVKPSVRCTVLARPAERPRALVHVAPRDFAAIPIPPGCTLRLRVTGPDGRPAAGLVQGFRATAKDGNGLGASVVRKASDPAPFSGTVSLAELGRGTFTVVFEADGFPLVRKEGVTLDGVHDASVEMPLHPGDSYAGRVVDGSTGEPIPGATVSVASEEGENAAVTDSRGCFRVQGLRGKIRCVSACAERYETLLLFRGAAGGPHHDPSVRLEASATGQVLRLWKPGVLIARVVPPKGRPLPRAVAFYLVHDGGASGGSTNNALSEGGTLRRSCQPGRIRAATVVAEGYAPCVVRDIDVASAGTVTVDFALGPGNTLSGRVTDADTGAPVPGALVRATGLFFVTLEAASGPDGRFELARLPRGASTLTVLSDRHLPASRDLTFPGHGAARCLDVTLERGGSLRGRVLDANGEPLADGYVELAMEKDESLYDASVGMDGSFLIENVRPGAYRLFFRGTFVEDVRIRKGETAQVTIRAGE